MRKAFAVVLAVVFLTALAPSAFAVDTGSKRIRSASKNRKYKKMAKNRKAPKAAYGVKRRH